MTTYELDELQKYLQEEYTICNTEYYLQSLNISTKYAKLYLSTHLFVKVPDFFMNLSNEFKKIINEVYNNENLDENLPRYEIMFNNWKQTEATLLIDELKNMKTETQSLYSETEDDQCKYCYNTQENIINIAETFFVQSKKK